MRSELSRLVHLDWVNEAPDAGRHIASIVALKPTRAERKELCELLKSTSNLQMAAIWTAVMGEAPHPEYHTALKETLNNDNPEVVYHAMWALLSGEYPDAMEMLFSGDRILGIFGDRLPKHLMGRWNDMTDEMICKFLELFCRRFDETISEVGLHTGWWLRAVAQLGVIDDEMAGILCRVWGELRPRDIDSRYQLVKTMARCPHPDFEPIIRAAKKSRVEDIKDWAVAGLEALREEFE